MRKETPLLVPFFPILVQNQIKSARFRYPDTLAELLDLKNTVRYVDTLARVKGTQGKITHTLRLLRVVCRVRDGVRCSTASGGGC